MAGSLKKLTPAARFLSLLFRQPMHVFTWKLSARTPPPPLLLFLVLPVSALALADGDCCWLLSTTAFFCIFHTGFVLPSRMPPTNAAATTRLATGAHFVAAAMEDSPRELLREQGALLTLRRVAAAAAADEEEERTTPAERLRGKGHRLMLSSAGPLELPPRLSFFGGHFLGRRWVAAAAGGGDDDETAGAPPERSGLETIGSFWSGRRTPSTKSSSAVSRTGEGLLPIIQNSNSEEDEEASSLTIGADQEKPRKD